MVAARTATGGLSWRRIAGALAALALVAQGTSSLSSAHGAALERVACEHAEVAPSPAATHAEHFEAPPDASGTEHPADCANDCCDGGMSGQCATHCVVSAIASETASAVEGRTVESPVPTPLTRLIEIPPTSDSPPPKG